MLTVRFLTAVPGVTVPSSGIRRAKLDLLHPTGHQSQQSRRYGVLLGHSASQAGHAPHHGSPVTAVPALRCPSRAFGEPSRTCFTPRDTNHSSPGVTVSFSGIRRAKQDVLHATRHQSQQSRRYGVLLGHSASQAGHHYMDHTTQQYQWSIGRDRIRCRASFSLRCSLC